MAWTAPKTYSVGEILTAAMMNTYQRDNMNDLDARLDYREVIAINTAVGLTIDGGSTAQVDFYSTTLAGDVLGTGGVIAKLRLHCRKTDAIATANMDVKAFYGSSQMGSVIVGFDTNMTDRNIVIEYALIGDGGVAAQRGYINATDGNTQISSTAAETSSDALTFKIAGSFQSGGSTLVGINIDVAEFFILRGP